MWSILAPIALPLVLRVLAGLGLGTLTYTGVDTVLSNFIDFSRSTMDTMPATMLAFASIAGVPKALGMICGAMTTRVTLWIATSATRWVTGAK
jgi:hypothetical protein